ncbi:MAG: helix-turn-helix transcriptional regulator [Clostridia bacterium]|nr:helix-turn-helix transcriptional regulator [Clostridia bacterium]
MTFLFRQNASRESSPCSALNTLGIEDVFLKKLSFEKDRKSITQKRHYHTNFEIHLIQKGFQSYAFESERVCVAEGMLLIIPPFVTHVADGEDPHTEKIALTFSLNENSCLAATLRQPTPFVLLETPGVLNENLQRILAELAEQKPFYRVFVENRILECILHLLRLLEVRDAVPCNEAFAGEDPRILLSKQYVEDNVCRNVTVSELASYCCLGEKQLERLFLKQVGCTVMQFVWQKRCRQIEKMLSDPTVSLREISERMGFANEYYFNSFFKKHAGMTPGAYRKSVLK